VPALGARDGGLIRIFVGSPNDIAPHRQCVRKAVETLNGLGLLKDHLEYVDWEIGAYPAPGRAQGVILEQIGPYDIFVGIVGHRIGSPTGKARSGTVEEYEAAYADHQRNDGVPGILMYFRRLQGFPNSDQLESLRPVVDFRERLNNENLAWEYDNEAHLAELALTHIGRTVNRLKSRAEERQAREANYGDEPVQLDARADLKEEVPDERDEHAIDLLDLRLKLESKLTWLSKHLLAGPDNPTFATIGSLAHDRFLPQDQARRVARLLAFDPGSIGSQDLTELQSFARAVAQDVANFRATVFDGYARENLRTAGWRVEDFEQQGKHRPDFLARKDGTSVRVAPRFVTTEISQIRDQAVARLMDTRDASPAATRRVVVIPDMSKSPTSGPNADPQVLKLRDLLSA
jgi:Domain of unknown function (DUF4062)